MNQERKVLLLAALVLGTSACATLMPPPASVQIVGASANGRAWVVGHQDKTTDTVYLCDAAGGKPICTAQQEAQP